MYFLETLVKDEEVVNDLRKEIDKLSNIYHNGQYNDVDGLFFSIRQMEAELHLAEKKS